jgi:hypothetical protein
MASSTSSISSPSNSVSKSSGDISDIQEAQEQKAARRVFYGNITLLAVTIIAIAAAAVAVFALHAISLHLWMIYPLIGLTLCFCVNNIGYFSPKNPIKLDENEPEDEAAQAARLERNLRAYLQEPAALNHEKIQEHVAKFARQPIVSADGATSQFIKDAHRIGEVVLVDHERAIVFPGNNDNMDNEHIKSSILAQLRAFATVNGELNEFLFYMLQEAASQNLEIASTQVPLKYRNMLVSPNFQKTGVKIERAKSGCFIIAHEYYVKIINSCKDSNYVNLNVIIEHEMDSQGRIVRSVRRHVKDEEPKLIERSLARPCPVLLAPRVFLGGSVPAPALRDEQIRDRS